VKLVWAVVQNEDAGNAVKALNSRGYRATRINTVGGLLKRGNVTLLAGVEAEHVDDVIETLREHCRSRSADDCGSGTGATVSRAVVFVLDAPGFLQV
jgi:uncharacterized protein YaaQ